MELLFVLPSVLIAVAIIHHSLHRARYPLPPGPKPLPVIGNFLDMPKTFEWVTFAAWSRLFQSDIISVKVLGTPMIILNSPQAASDLLEKRSNVYSSRPTGLLVMLTELIGWNRIFIMMPYGKALIESRKLAHQEFNPKDTSQYEPQVRKSVRIFLHNLLSVRDSTMSRELVNMLRYMLGTISLSVIYGISPEPIEQGDPFIATANRAMTGFTAAAIPGRFLVDFIPTLKYIPSWFPGAGFQTKARSWRADLIQMINGPFEAVQKKIKSGERVATSFVSHCMAKTAERENKESLVKHVAASLLTGGTDTTVTAMHSFFLAMVCNPDVQLKAQRELDAVVGGDRLPDYEDMDSLPYVQAVVHEVLRWQPVTPLGPLRCTTDHDVYRGYYIPKDCTVVANVWAYLHDEATYGPDPETFNPDRWLTEKGNLNPDIPEPFAQFGYGRRQCPGQHIAMSTLYLGVASVLHAFHIKKAVDERGNDITPTQEYLPTFQNRPAEFPCVVQVRSLAHEHAIQEGYAGATAE